MAGAAVFALSLRPREPKAGGPRPRTAPEPPDRRQARFSARAPPRMNPGRPPVGPIPRRHRSLGRAQPQADSCQSCSFYGSRGLWRGLGGMHYLFTYPAGQNIRNWAGKLAEGLDVRGEGGYIVVPPSATTRPYEVLDPRPWPRYQAWLLEALRRPQRAAQANIQAAPAGIGAENGPYRANNRARTPVPSEARPPIGERDAHGWVEELEKLPESLPAPRPSLPADRPPDRDRPGAGKAMGREGQRGPRGARLRPVALGGARPFGTDSGGRGVKHSRPALQGSGQADG